MKAASSSEKFAYIQNVTRWNSLVDRQLALYRDVA